MIDGSRRILFVTLSNIGDLVMTTPLLEALHAHYPEHLIDLVADARSSELLSACPYRGRLLHKEKQLGLFGTVQLIRELRQLHYELVVDLRSPFMSLFLRCRRSAFKQRGGHAEQHAVEDHFSALRPILGSDASIPKARLWLDDKARGEAQALLGRCAGERTLAVAPGANWPGKIWPLENYIETLNRLHEHFDRVLILGSAADRERGAALSTGVNNRSINLAGATSLNVAAACLAEADAFIGNDSGLGHIAAALDVPSLSLFGPGRPERYRPWGARSEIVLAPNALLSELRPDKVVQALLSHLNNCSEAVLKS